MAASEPTEVSQEFIQLRTDMERAGGPVWVLMLISTEFVIFVVVFTKSSLN